MKSIHYNQKYFSDRDHLDLQIANSIRLFCQANNLKSILDVGCGTGRLVHFLRTRSLNARGCDISEEAVKMARIFNRKNLIKHCSATALDYNDGEFDLLVSISVIEHLNKKQGEIFIKESHRVLKPNAWIFLITPNFNSPLRFLRGKKWFAYSDPTHKYFYTPQSLSTLLKKHDFTSPRLRFKIDPNETFNWHLPIFFHDKPQWLQTYLTWTMISSPLSTIRDSFWIAAKKSKEP